MSTSMRVEFTVAYEVLDRVRSVSKDPTMQVPHAALWLARHLQGSDSILAGDILYALMYERNATAIRALDNLYRWAGDSSRASVEIYRDIRAMTYHMQVAVLEAKEMEVNLPPAPTPNQATEPTTPQARRLNFRGLKSISTDGRKTR